MSSNTRTVNVEDVTQQSKDRLNDRVAAAEALAVAHNERVAGEEEAKRRREALEAELTTLNDARVREHKDKHQAALKAGWTVRDLRAMGLDLPTKQATSKRRRRKTSASTNAQATDERNTQPNVTPPSEQQSAEPAGQL